MVAQLSRPGGPGRRWAGIALASALAGCGIGARAVGEESAVHRSAGGGEGGPLHFAGTYFADRDFDRNNWVDPVSAAPGDKILTVLAAECYDNGEGDYWPHGPFASVNFDFFPAAEPHWPDGLSPPGARRRCYRRPDDPRSCRRRLRGPHTGEDVGMLMPRPTYEWLDYEWMTYTWSGDPDTGPGLYEWRQDQQAVVMRLWESDPRRRNDVLGVELIDLARTETAGGVWVEFHRYSGGKPRKPKNKVAFRLLLRTVTAPIRTSSPVGGR